METVKMSDSASPEKAWFRWFIQVVTIRMIESTDRIGDEVDSPSISLKILGGLSIVRDGSHGK
jgi:hypothetical protein